MSSQRTTPRLGMVVAGLAIALPILRHRLVRNYKAEAEGMTVDRIVESVL